MPKIFSERWFQILIGFLLVVGLLFGIYFWGKSNGRSSAQSKFDKRQEELLKKSQEADSRADMWKAKADSSEFYASKLSEEIALNRKNASLNQKIYEEAYLEEKKEIDKKYEDAKSFIASDLTVCERCRDLCQRSNQLTAYGPEFADAKCDAASQCADACGTDHP